VYSIKLITSSSFRNVCFKLDVLVLERIFGGNFIKSISRLFQIDLRPSGDDLFAEDAHFESSSAGPIEYAADKFYSGGLSGKWQKLMFMQMPISSPLQILRRRPSTAW